MKILELKGFKSVRAFNAFHTLLLGLKMTPLYLGENYDKFYSRVECLTEAEKEKILKEAFLFVNLEPDEIEALACFACDFNDIPFTKHNLNNLAPDEIMNICVAVCMEIAKIKIDLVNKDEKKK